MEISNSRSTYNVSISEFIDEFNKKNPKNFASIRPQFTKIIFDPKESINIDVYNFSNFNQSLDQIKKKIKFLSPERKQRNNSNKIFKKLQIDKDNYEKIKFGKLKYDLFFYDRLNYYKSFERKEKLRQINYEFFNRYS